MHLGGNHLEDNLPTQSHPKPLAPTPIADATPYPTIATSYPDQILRHNISDEELDMLCEQRKEHTREMMWASIGVVGGALPGTIAGTITYIWGEKSGTVAPENLAQIIFFFVGLALGTAAYFIQARRGANAVDLKDAIRARTRKLEERRH
jgi:hypothetical protein